MQYFDVCNGDADGLFALHQLRLATPRNAVLITGPKRDNALLARVTASPGDHVTALDLSFDANRAAVLALLARGVTIDYIDHHVARELPRHPLLHTDIDTASDVCTSVLVDRRLRGRYRAWAVAATFGDNLPGAAHRLAQLAGIDPDDEATLRELGENVNYAGYGDSIGDLLIEPAALYTLLEPYAQPLDFAGACPLLATLGQARREDLTLACAQRPAATSAGIEVFTLPGERWARRVRGAFANQLALAAPQRAHAVLTPTAEGYWTVSVRAPLATAFGADSFCRRFGGAGRAGAAGIGRLPYVAFDAFVAAFHQAYEMSA
ncbi:acetyltransferase [Paraburkholderia sp. J7]|uniref:acetyltransferase n=1 Tax=Paraburkholderia sp. J7 TaxID=2805438 RepID=UPI002AB723DC|nr:acetyltransferase [Paraburkholderia sp. J7]